ncbi:MAG TPA: tetratricopeptide repeat protein [Vicinamibacterales bacterium]|jgi:tetratricopeptide (TPR) repeat protein|nr:tetratricopeptide repeat protein [Vicinamibacterales bacterium]
MVRRVSSRQLWLAAIAFAAFGQVAQTAAAQGAQGRAEGIVRDAKGTPVEGATVVFQAAANSRKVETKTNRAGEYRQTGLAPGDYTVSAAKGDLIAPPMNTKVGAGETIKADLVVADRKEIEAAAKAEAAKNTAFKTAFDAGAAALSANKPDEAIAKFTEATTASPTCSDCYANLGTAYMQKKDYDNAEKAFLKSNEIKPNATSYTGLASVYTAQKKLDQAATAMSKATELSAAAPGGAAGGGNADALFNQGVTLWNAGKIDEAKKQFQAAVAADPNHAEAHYQLGMALVNEGNLAGAKTEWETYLKLSPQGSHAAEVGAMLPQLK